MKDIIIRLRSQNRLALTFILLTSCLTCFILFVCRVYVSASPTFFFLNWNLFLAGIPFGISTLLLIYPKIKERKYLFYGMLFTWLMFFPNAPYIITDFVHLKARPIIPEWFDIVLLFLFAWTGLMMGLISLIDIERIMTPKFGSVKVKLGIIMLLFLSAYGVYLGRVLRWNSWDVFYQPINLLLEALSPLFSPSLHIRAWGITFLYGLLLNLVYWTLKSIQVEKRT